MALFSKKTDKEIKAAPKVPAKETPKKVVVKSVSDKKAEKKSEKPMPGILLSPRQSEKASALAERGVYVFLVAKGANKPMISKAIEVAYKVKPLKIAIVKIPPRTIVSRGHYGYQSGAVKAYVYLKKGETINLN